MMSQSVVFNGVESSIVILVEDDTLHPMKPNNKQKINVNPAIKKEQKLKKTHLDEKNAKTNCIIQ
jgi:hypothetical protein